MKYGKEKKTAMAPTASASAMGRRLRLSVGLLALLGLLSFSAWAQDPWHTEVVDNGGGADVGRFSSLAIDASGDLHIGYYDATAHLLRYAFRSHKGGQWYVLPLLGTAPAYEYCSLAVDAQGRPHLSFIWKNEGLAYAYFDGVKWHKFLVDNIRAAYYNSIQIDAQGHPHISYYQEYSGAPNSTRNETSTVLHLKYAFFDGQQWYVQTVDWRTGSGKYNAMAVDANGVAHIAYERIGAGELLYAQGKLQHWQFGTVDPGRQYRHTVGPGVSIALDRAGNPHIAYLDITSNVVKYASWDGSKWNLQLVDHLVGRALLQHVSVKMDSQGRAHIAYYDAGMQALKYAVQNKDGFHVEVVDRQGNVGLSPSLCLDAQDRPYIAYYDVGGRQLKFAWRESGGAPSVARTAEK